MIDLIKNLFYIDSLACIVIILIAFIGTMITNFSIRYLHGDSRYYSFFKEVIGLVIFLIGLVAANNLIVFYAFWAISNLLLVRLMVHKSTWQAAQAAGFLAQKNFCKGFILLLIAFFALYLQTGSLSIDVIVQKEHTSLLGYISSMILLLVAMTQSALWPFHRWLLSSLNSPTPVSALMHAGLINGGGFLLARFAPLFLCKPFVLHIIFIIGFISSLLGVLFKLLQNDVKRMLACSTMGQMGFMFVQCGLGFFGAAIAHFVWHGLFKAYLFLSSASNIEERYEIDKKIPSVWLLPLALGCGLMTAYCFVFVSFQKITLFDTTIVMAGVVAITGAQFALSILNRSIKMLPVALLASACMGSIYGFNVYIIECYLDTYLMEAQSLSVIHVIGFVIYLMVWISMVWVSNWYSVLSNRPWFMHVYVKLLNMSQAAPSTVTSYRNFYRYK